MKKIKEALHAKDMKAARALICGAKARQNQHQPCRQPAMKNGRCRLHGGKSTGAKTDAGKHKVSQANLRHGMYTKATMLERFKFKQLLSLYKDQD